MIYIKLFHYICVMDLQEYFVELLDRNILIDFPDDFDVALFKIEGISRHDYSIATLPIVFRDLANIAEILDNILTNLKNEINSVYYIEFDKDIQDYKNEIRFHFSFKFTHKSKKIKKVDDDDIAVNTYYEDFFSDF